MDPISANLALRGKNIWGYKKAPGGQKPIRKTEKKVGAFFFVFVGDSQNFVGVAKKSAGGTKW